MAPTRMEFLQLGWYSDSQDQSRRSRNHARDRTRPAMRAGPQQSRDCPCQRCLVQGPDQPRGQGPLCDERHPPRPVRQDHGPGRGRGWRRARGPAWCAPGPLAARGRGRGASGRGAGVRRLAAGPAARGRGCGAGAGRAWRDAVARFAVAGHPDALSRPDRARWAPRGRAARGPAPWPQGPRRPDAAALARRPDRAGASHRRRLRTMLVTLNAMLKARQAWRDPREA